MISNIVSEFIPIVFATDHNYVMPTGVAIHSLLKSGEIYHIVVITGEDVTPLDKEMLKKEVTINSKESIIEFIESDGTFKDSPVSRHISNITYYRFLIPWLLPQYDKVIYCDPDVIFMTPLKKVYKGTDLKESLIAAVRRQYKEDTIYYKNVLSIGLDTNEYINAGFLIINCKMMRDLHLLPELIEMSKQEYLLLDQDILNLICKNKIVYLPNRFNVTSEKMTAELLEGESIIHYTGSKPWNDFKCCWIEWWTNYRESVFYNPNIYITVSEKIRIETKLGNNAKNIINHAPIRIYLRTSEKFHLILNKSPFLKNLYLRLRKKKTKVY